MDFTDKYKSKYWKLLKEREEQEHEQERQFKEEIFNRHKKKLDYARNVMSIYKPKISKKKQLEMTLIKKNLEDPNSLSKMKRELMSTQNKNNKSMTVSVDRGVGSDIDSKHARKRRRSKAKPLDEKRYSYHPIQTEKHEFIK